MKNILLILLAPLMMACGYNESPAMQHTDTTTIHKARSKPPRSTGSTAASHLCGHPTRKGTPCKRKVAGTTGYCWQHSK